MSSTSYEAKAMAKLKMVNRDIRRIERDDDEVITRRKILADLKLTLKKMKFPAEPEDDKSRKVSSMLVRGFPPIPL